MIGAVRNCFLKLKPRWGALCQIRILTFDLIGGTDATNVPIANTQPGHLQNSLRECDLDEKFVRGSGPGGQSVNKSRNKVQLTHKPTG